MTLEITLFALVIVSTYLCCNDIDMFNNIQNAERSRKRPNQ
jgi:hypothetical protein